MLVLVRTLHLMILKTLEEKDITLSENEIKKTYN